MSKIGGSELDFEVGKKLCYFSGTSNKWLFFVGTMAKYRGAEKRTERP